MDRRYVLAFSAMFLSLLLSCGNSPLFNHRKEEPEIQIPTVQETQPCMLLFSEKNLCASWKWEEGPKQGENRLRLFFSNHENHQPADILRNVNIELWMPGMGHGSLPTSVTAVSTGEFLVENIVFTMPGEWEIRIQILTEDGTIAEQNSFKLVI